MMVEGARRTVIKIFMGRTQPGLNIEKNLAVGPDFYAIYSSKASSYFLSSASANSNFVSSSLDTFTLDALFTEDFL